MAVVEKLSIGSETYRASVYCTYRNPRQYIGMKYRPSEVIAKPIWCAMDKDKEKNNILMMNNVTTPLNFYTVMTNIPSIIKWEDIKKDGIYHVPPLGNISERMDICIQYKGDDTLGYKVFKNTSSGRVLLAPIHTLYKSSLIAKRLVPHKMVSWHNTNEN